MNRIVMSSIALALSLSSLMACSPSQIANAVKTGASLVNGSTSTSGSISSSKPSSFPASVKQVDLTANSKVSVKGTLESGVVMDDLSWASSSQNACFPATQNSKFRAKHVLFHTKLPPRSILNIKLIPDDTSKAMSLYAYQIGATNYDVVPNLSSSTTCEADHINDRPVAGKTEDGTRKVTLNATTNPYNVVIGVSGNAGVTGGFTLEFELQQ